MNKTLEDKGRHKKRRSKNKVKTRCRLREYRNLKIHGESVI